MTNNNNKLELSDVLEMMPTTDSSAVAQEKAERQELLDQIWSLIISKGASIRLTGECEDGEVDVTMRDLEEAITVASNKNLRGFLSHHAIWSMDGMVIRIR